MEKSNSDNKNYDLDDRLYRISIQLYKSQYSKLKNLSRPGLSISSIIRDSLELYISKLDQKSSSENENNLQELSTSSENNNILIPQNSESYIEAELIKLSSLENKGLISNEEYKILRNKVLGI
tara:strand:- start:334 stop:702 length:369 start_codon:yes stop_codon:yes gene_type:complete